MIFREMNKITNEIYDKEKILCENISYLNGFAILLGNKSDLKKADTID